MDRTSLGIAGATLAACAFFGSLGAAQPAQAASLHASDVGSIASSATTFPAIPLVPRRGGPRNGGGSHPVFTVDDSAQHVGSDRLHKAASLAGYASASDGIAASGVIAAADTPTQRGRAIDSRPARAPPTT